MLNDFNFAETVNFTYVEFNIIRLKHTEKSSEVVSTTKHSAYSIDKIQWFSMHNGSYLGDFISTTLLNQYNLFKAKEELNKCNPFNT